MAWWLLSSTLGHINWLGVSGEWVGGGAWHSESGCTHCKGASRQKLLGISGECVAGRD